MTSSFPGARRSIVDRMRGAALLDVATYEEVEHDTSATGQAAVVVALAALGAVIGSLFSRGPGLIAALVGSLVGWLLWSAITYFVGTRVFGGTATWGELLRTLGFAQAPGIFRALGIVPLLGGLAKGAVWVWLLATGIVAIRQALDVPTGKAVLTAVIGWVAALLVFGIVGRLLGVPIY